MRKIYDRPNAPGYWWQFFTDGIAPPNPVRVWQAEGEWIYKTLHFDCNFAVPINDAHMKWIPLEQFPLVLVTPPDQ